MRIPVLSQTGRCRVCGAAAESFNGDFVCDVCSGAGAPRFDASACALAFDGPARRMLLDFKFNRHLWLRDDLADWLEGAVRARLAADAVDAVLPVPSTSAHLWDRGYSQCVELASALAVRLSRRLDAKTLARRGRPRRQAGLPEELRRANVRGTFAVRRPEMVRGRTLLLVDDIMTTGATLSEAAAALKEAGAWRVWCAAVARAVRD